MLLITDSNDYINPRIMAEVEVFRAVYDDLSLIILTVFLMTLWVFV